MLGVQHQRDIEGLLHHFVRLLAGQRVQEIGRKPQLADRPEPPGALAQPVQRSDDGRGLGHQLQALVWLASGDMSCACGSYSASMETAVRSAAIGTKPFGQMPQETFHRRRKRPVRHQLRLQRHRVPPAWANARSTTGR